MRITLKQITISALIDAYSDNGEDGVVGFGGKLDIRPPFQREFVYNDKQRIAVIDTVTKGLPLNTIYWADNENGSFEVIDGQQRTISIAQYVNSEFSINYRYFHNLSTEEKGAILNYELLVYWCAGSDTEKLDWFNTINIAGETLTKQELRNAVYTGEWLSSAKRYFSKTASPAYTIGKNYIKGRPIRQDYLEIALKWVGNDEEVEEYMAKHQHDADAKELWNYFEDVLIWTKATFPNYRKEMKGLSWGLLYNIFKDTAYNSRIFENDIKVLMIDEDVTNKRGVYEYLLTKDTKHLNLRVFSPKQIREQYERQSGVCVKCNNTFSLEEMEADHITPWSKGGRTDADNCQMLCEKCNREKSDK